MNRLQEKSEKFDAVVLGGGGEKGPFQAGAMLALAESGFDPEVLVGTSVGAWNAAKLGMAKLGIPQNYREDGTRETALVQECRELCDLWRETKTEDIRSGSVAGTIAKAVFGGNPVSIYDNAPARDLLEREIDLERLRGSGRQVMVCSVNWHTEEHRAVSQHDAQFLKWVMASSSFPILFPPELIDSELWTDGGVRNVLAIGEAIRLGADHITVIPCANDFDRRGHWRGGKWFLDYIPRVLEIVMRELGRNDFETTGDRNALAQLQEKYKDVRLRIIAPPKPLEAPEPLAFVPELSREWIKVGYEEAQRVLAEEYAAEASDAVYDE